MTESIGSRIQRRLFRSLGAAGPANLSPFVYSEIELLGQKLRLLSHQQDQVLSAMLRGERSLCPLYRAELAWLISAVQPGDFVLDAGGNIGSVSMALALREPTATIAAFEPDPLNYGLLQANTTLNACAGIHAFNLALGRTDGLVRFYRSPDNYGDHRTSKPKGLDLREQEFAPLPIAIPCVCGSQFLRQVFPHRRFNLMKIDTQGADFEILGDVQSLLADGGRVAIEYSPYHLDTHGTTRDEVAQALGGFSRVDKICPDEREMFRLEPIDVATLLAFFDAEHSRYRTHFDIILYR